MQCTQHCTRLTVRSLQLLEVWPYSEENKKAQLTQRERATTVHVWRPTANKCKIRKIVFGAAGGEDLMILACTVFAWSTRVTDGQTDRRTELQWLRRAIAVPAVVRKNEGRTGHAFARYFYASKYISIFSNYMSSFVCLTCLLSFKNAKYWFLHISYFRSMPHSCRAHMCMILHYVQKKTHTRFLLYLSGKCLD